MPPVTTRPASTHPREIQTLLRTSEPRESSTLSAMATAATAATATGLLSNTVRIARQAAAAGHAVLANAASALEGCIGGSSNSTSRRAELAREHAVILLRAEFAESAELRWRRSPSLSTGGRPPEWLRNSYVSNPPVAPLDRPELTMAELLARSNRWAIATIPFAEIELPNSRRVLTDAGSRAFDRMNIQNELAHADTGATRKQEILQEMADDPHEWFKPYEYEVVMGELGQAFTGRENSLRPEGVTIPPFLNGETPSTDPAELLDQTIKFVRSWNQG
jgi:hypothetical protein